MNKFYPAILPPNVIPFPQQFIRRLTPEEETEKEIIDHVQKHQIRPDKKKQEAAFKKLQACKAELEFRMNKWKAFELVTSRGINSTHPVDKATVKEILDEYFGKKQN